jgi:hypothetical protein
MSLTVSCVGRSIMSDPFFDAVKNEKMDIDDEIKVIEDMDERLYQKLDKYGDVA